LGSLIVGTVPIFIRKRKVGIENGLNVNYSFKILIYTIDF
jgi:hypothetical protein